MALTDAQKTSLLFKKAQGVAETSTSKQFFEEGYLGRPLVFGNEVWSEAGSIQTTAPVLADDATSGVVKFYSNRSMSAIPGVSNSFYLAELKDSIPFNFGDGSYNYVIKTNADALLGLGGNNIIVDNAAGVLTFYGSIPSNMPPKISFYKYVGQKGVTTGSDVALALADYIPLTQKAAALGVASLDSNIHIPLAQIAGLVNANIDAAAAIDYSKLNIPAAAIAYSKLAISDADLTIAKTSGLQAALDAKLALAGGTMTGNIAMGLNTITSSKQPVNATDMVNKAYLDQQLANMDFQADVAGHITSDATDPGLTPTLNTRYILDTATYHANFGTITGFGSGDIVQFNGTDWVVVFDVSVHTGGGILVWSTADESFFNWGGAAWSPHGGLAGVTPGVGLGKSGNTMYVKLGAGIAELPTGEVAVDCDNSTLELSDATSDAKVRIKDGGVTNAKLAGSIAQSKITGLTTALSDLATADTNEVTNRNTAISTAIGTEVTDRNTAIAAEATARDTAISTAISTEVSNRNSAIGTAVSAEATARDTAISTAISTEVTDRNTAISTAISTEVTDRNTAIASEATARDTAISTAISTEVTDRNSAISTAISTEVTNRNSAISTAVSAEATARDTAISTAISTEVTDRNSAISSAISTEVTNRNTAIAAEATARDTAISTAISTEVTDRNSAISTAISTEVTNRNTAIAAEATARDTAISTAISTEVTDRNSAISTAISTEVTNRNSAISTAITVYSDAEKLKEYTNGEAGDVSAGQICYYDTVSSKMKIAKANALATCRGLFAIVSDSIIATVTLGKYSIQVGTRISGASGLVEGPVFIAKAGGLTQDLSAYGTDDVIMEIGFALSATEWEYAPKSPITIKA